MLRLSFPRIRAIALPMASDGSLGVEKTFRIRRRPFSIQTQSVKVPPVSTAIRSGSEVDFFFRVEVSAVLQKSENQKQCHGNAAEPSAV